MLAKLSPLRIVGVLVLLCIAFVPFAWYGPTPFIQNIAFLIIGCLLALATTFAVEWKKRVERTQELSRILHAELSDLVGRCCFDFESPWQKILQSGSTAVKQNVVWIQKFLPGTPTIYRAVASELPMLGDGVTLDLIHFHYRLEALRREIQNIVEDKTSENTMTPLEDSALRKVALRFKQTLPFGLKALEQLSKDNPDAEKTETRAINLYDEFRDVPKPEGSLRDRIRALLK
jgi:hypothetical protein